jgi:glycerophosphoryl diester phosphodiesterase
MNTRKRLRRLGTILLAIAAITGAIYGVAVLTARPMPPHPWFAARAGEHVPLVFAHQGGENLRPSNTMLAFQHAVDLGADVLDTDLHMTKDGALVLMHDETVDRTTDGVGAIRHMTLAELKRLDAGYRFSTDGGRTFPYRGKGSAVPTLEELFQAFPGKRFGIEIKQTPPAVAVPFCALIRRYNMQDRVLVSGFRQANMDAFRQECPEVATSATEDEVRLFFILSTLGLSAAISPNYQSLQVPEYSGQIHVLTPRFIAAAHSRGLAVQPWTIDEEADLRRVLSLGVDGINTNYPDRLLALVKYSRSSRSAFSPHMLASLTGGSS